MTYLTQCVVNTFLFMYCGIILACMALNVKTTFYTSEYTAAQSGSAKSVIVSLSATCLTECAILCLNDKKCISYSFEEKSNVCHMSSEMISNTNGTAYATVVECPAVKGYRLYKHQDILLCLKISDNKAYRSVAESHCNNDGTHLLLLTTEAMHMFVKDILRAYGTGSVSIDGRDVYNNDTLFSWIDEPIPYTKWVPGSPDGGQDDCLRLSASGDFDFRDLPCDIYTLKYICQKDLNKS